MYLQTVRTNHPYKTTIVQNQLTAKSMVRTQTVRRKWLNSLAKFSSSSHRRPRKRLLYQSRTATELDRDKNVFEEPCPYMGLFISSKKYLEGDMTLLHRLLVSCGNLSLLKCNVVAEGME
ncbi:hypothetical protein AVEN_193035-1 [Araneus ventricosus]|uniref:Uncharacterized protein n=1 Tax=Araneus ventricosus TaxID=182803 RepID=A0A4Y2Q7I0_ARAVE|nr:hypothetical protein AVEN_193035-1 [Araneus ventricosus]